MTSARATTITNGTAKAIQEMVRFFLSEGLLPLAGVIDVVPIFARDTVIELDDSWLVVRAARATQAMRETLLRSDGYQRLERHANAIPDLGELISKTNKYFTRDGKLREEASAELRAIRNRVHQKRNAIQKLLTDVMNRNADAIQEPLIVLRGDGGDLLLSEIARRLANHFMFGGQRHRWPASEHFGN